MSRVLVICRRKAGLSYYFPFFLFLLSDGSAKAMCIFPQAAFTPEELYSRKRTLDRHVGDVTPIVKKLKLSSAEGSTAGAQAEVAEEEVSVLSDEDVTKLVGSADACKLDVSFLSNKGFY